MIDCNILFFGWSPYFGAHFLLTVSFLYHLSVNFMGQFWFSILLGLVLKIAQEECEKLYIYPIE